MDSTIPVQVAGDHIQIALPGEDRLSFPRVRLPEVFLQWQSEARMRMFDILKTRGAEAMRMQPAHLPVLTTLGEGAFPVNLATRGLGVLPSPERMESLAHLFEETRRRTEGRPWPETLPGVLHGSDQERRHLGYRLSRKQAGGYDGASGGGGRYPAVWLGALTIEAVRCTICRGS